MFVYDNLGLIIGGVFALGVVAHFDTRRRQRRRYARLRVAYEGSLRLVCETEGAPGAVVRAVELEREFTRAWLPGWFDGFGRRVRTMLKLCAALTLFAFFLKGPIERGEEVAAERARRAARTGPSGSTVHTGRTLAPRSTVGARPKNPRG